MGKKTTQKIKGIAILIMIAHRFQDMRSIARKNILGFICFHNVSFKFKLYAIAACLGY